MAPRPLDVLEDRSDPGVGSVAEHVDVELDRVLEEAVDERRSLDRELRSAPRDVDPAAADHMMRPHEYRVAELLGSGEPVLRTGRLRPRRRTQPQLVE